ncbi:MAG: hypothetical protein ACK5MR_05080 [Cumulibacter sp.]
MVSNSPYSSICVAVGRGYLDDPPASKGLAHLFEHMWFAQELDTPTVEWGETRENAVVLHHLCPSDDLPAVVDALARRFRLYCAARPEEIAQRAATELKLISLEERTAREQRGFGFPRRDIARALQRDPEYNPIAVDTGAAYLDDLSSFPAGCRLAVCVAGPRPQLSPEDIAAAFAVESDFERVWPVPALTGSWATDVEGCAAAAWILPSNADAVAAVWLVAELIDQSVPPPSLRWVSGRVVSPYGATPVRGGHLFAIAAGIGSGHPPDLLNDYLLRLLDEPIRLGGIRRSIAATRIEAADQAAIDAVDLIGRATDHDAVRLAASRASNETIGALADLLSRCPHARFGANRA